MPTASFLPSWHGCRDREQRKRPVTAEAVESVKGLPMAGVLEQYENGHPKINVDGMQHQAAADAAQQDLEQALAGHVRTFEAISIGEGPSSSEAADAQARQYNVAGATLCLVLDVRYQLLSCAAAGRERGALRRGPQAAARKADPRGLDEAVFCIRALVEQSAGSVSCQCLPGCASKQQSRSIPLAATTHLQ